MTKELEKEVIGVLLTLKEDAKMALSGDWGVADFASDEHKKGFEHQIILINKVLAKIHKQ
jgi:hypothetical protein